MSHTPRHHYVAFYDIVDTQTASFRRKRLYEVLNNRIRKDDERIEEVLVSMQEGGARYRTIRAKMTVRKMRAMVSDDRKQLWLHYACPGR